MQIKNILVPIDYSTSSYDVFELGYCLAKLKVAHLHLLHVIDSDYYNQKQHEIFDDKFIHKTRIENAKEELQKFKLEVSRSDVKIIEVLIEGDPQKDILNYARRNEIDLIVIASHGWTNLPHMVIGNIADKVLKQSEVPVVCIKSNLPVIKSREMRRHGFAENWVE